MAYDVIEMVKRKDKECVSCLNNSNRYYAFENTHHVKEGHARPQSLEHITCLCWLRVLSDHAIKMRWVFDYGPKNQTGTARCEWRGMTDKTLDAMTPMSIRGNTRKAHAGVKVMRSWHLWYQLMLSGTQILKRKQETKRSENHFFNFIFWKLELRIWIIQNIDNERIGWKTSWKSTLTDQIERAM